LNASHLGAGWQAPLQWADMAGKASVQHRAQQMQRLLKAAFVVALLSLTVLDRFGLRLGELYAAHPALLALYGIVLLMLLAGAAELNVRGAVHYVAVACIAALSYLVNANVGSSLQVSIASWLLLMVLYAPFMISIREGAASASLWLWVTKMYMGFTLFIAAAGIAQFLTQFVFHPAWLFDYTLFIPAPIRGFEVWNRVISVGGDWFKSNGFFLREPSLFSLQMAFGLLVELSMAKRRWVLAILTLALLLSYSGSGLLVLALGLLFPLGRYTLLRFAAAAGLAALVFATFGEVLNLSYTAGRIDEFISVRSSAYCRFVEPAVATFQHHDANGWTTLLGHGPGTLRGTAVSPSASFSSQGTGTCETTFAKIPFEYGLLGVLALGLLVLGALSASAVPIRIRAGLAAIWVTQPLLLGPDWVLLTYMLCAMWPDGSKSLVGFQERDSAAGRRQKG
jgi:hypothetical protein